MVAVPAGGAGAVRALVAVGKRKETAGGLRLLGAVAAAYAAVRTLRVRAVAMAPHCRATRHALEGLRASTTDV